LLNHITGGANAETFQPMNINFGLFPPVDGKFKGKIGGKEKRKALTSRALNDLEDYLLENPERKRAASAR
jgi:methylenetetrahydrofolate--tRNA-(uracil-5-)-methyltransferase